MRFLMTTALALVASTAQAQGAPTYSATIVNNGWCQVARGFDWIQAARRPGPGQCDVQIPRGVFYNTPTCVCTAETDAFAAVCQVLAHPNPGFVRFKVHRLTDAQGADSTIHVRCSE